MIHSYYSEVRPKNLLTPTLSSRNIYSYLKNILIVAVFTYNIVMTHSNNSDNVAQGSITASVETNAPDLSKGWRWSDDFQHNIMVDHNTNTKKRSILSGTQEGHLTVRLQSDHWFTKTGRRAKSIFIQWLRMMKIQWWWRTSRHIKLVRTRRW